MTSAAPASSVLTSTSGPASTGPSVAYVMSRFPRLTETFVMNEIEAVRRAGADVTINPLIREKADLVHPEAAVLAAQARYLPFLSPAIIASQVALLARRPRAYLGALWAVLRGTWGSANFLVGALGIFAKSAHLARRLEAEGADHVHCHFATHPAVAGFIVHRLTGIPFSFTAHGSDLHVDRHMLPQKVAEAAFVVAISEFNRNVILETCGPSVADKVVVVRCGVDRALFADQPAPPARRDGGAAVRLCCIGTLHEVKGQRHLIEACRILAADGVAVRCSLVGGGPDRADLEAAIASAGLAGSVDVTGPRTRQEVAAIVAGSDVLVAPSVPTRQGKREGIPVVLLEAMASGVPVVASRLSGIPELVEHEVSGLLVEPGDARGIADAVRRLLDDRAFAGRLAVEGRRRVDEEFDLDRSAATLVARFSGGV